MRGARVAGDHDGLHALRQEPLEDLEAVAANGLGRFRPVGNPGGVAEIDRGLVREPLEDGAGDGEAADPGIEDADRRGVHRKRTGTEAVAAKPPGAARSWSSPGKSQRCADTYASSADATWLIPM